MSMENSNVSNTTGKQAKEQYFVFIRTFESELPLQIHDIILHHLPSQPLNPRVWLDIKSRHRRSAVHSVLERPLP